jgi:hypothetical protein
MLSITLVLSLISLGMLCRVLFALAVHALPFFVAVSIGLSILNAGSDLGSAVLVGLVAGMLTAAVGRVAFAAAPCVIVRLMIMTMFVLPSAIAGYHGVHGLAWFAAPSTFWRGVLGWVGAVLVCVAACRQLAGFDDSRSAQTRAQP